MDKLVMTKLVMMPQFLYEGWPMVLPPPDRTACGGYELPGFGWAYSPIDLLVCGLELTIRGTSWDGPLDKWFRSVPLRASESKVFLAILSHETVSHEAVVVYESVSHFKALNDAEVLRVLKANAPLTMMKGELI